MEAEESRARDYKRGCSRRDKERSRVLFPVCRVEDFTQGISGSWKEAAHVVVEVPVEVGVEELGRRDDPGAVAWGI